MLRARHTAKEIHPYVQNVTLRRSKLLNEVRTSYEGCPGAEIDARNGDVYTGADTSSEQPQDLVARTRKFIARMRSQFPGGRVAAVTHGDIVTFMVLWAKGQDLTPRNKTRLLQIGFPSAYPAHASITTLLYDTADPDETPIVQYTSVTGER
jgi:broad specificity phosphatase PhoE